MQQGALYLWQTNYLFVDLLLFMSREGDEAKLPSFATHHPEIQVSSMSLEVLIASLWPAVGIAKEATLLMAIKLLIAVD